MIRIITGLFDTVDDAQSVAKELMDRGIPREDISMVAPDVSTTNAQQHAVGAEHPMSTGAAMTGDTGQEVKDSREVITQPGAVVKTRDATAADLLIGARTKEGHELR
jgi:hypothetical protein